MILPITGSSGMPAKRRRQGQCLARPPPVLAHPEQLTRWILDADGEGREVDHDVVALGDALLVESAVRRGSG